MLLGLACIDETYWRSIMHVFWSLQTLLIFISDFIISSISLFKM